MSTIESAIAVAAEAHAGQLDKGGEPYILHPLRVMLAVSPPARIAAVLHDVIEDSRWTADGLWRAGFGTADVTSIVVLTRRPSETYSTFIERCASDAIAREVKIADIGDNLLPSRCDRLPVDVRQRLETRYRTALLALRGAG